MAHWDTRETAVAYMEGRLEGNTLITDVSQGYMPGELSYRPQKRHITSMKPTFENSFMNDFKDSLPVDEDTFKFYEFVKIISTSHRHAYNSKLFFRHFKRNT